MAYVSLYRKYRPQTFAEVVGQGHITTTLANAIVEGRSHHAYLFTGPRGTGKTSTARILAKALDCERGPTAQPCNACGHCTAITAGSHVDVVEIDAASHGGVDDVRDLRERVALAPAGARTKVYIVDECHMLSMAGWNAFLKTVEEPPGHVVFVFATTEPHKVPDTILSRTQRFDFKRVGAATLATHLGQVSTLEGLDFEPGAADLIVRAGDGSVRDALSVLDQIVAFTGSTVTVRGVAEVLGAVPEDLLAETADLIAAGDVAGLCGLVQRLADGGQDLRQFARESVEHLRALLLLQVAPDGGLVAGTAERLNRLAGQAQRLGRCQLLRAIELLAEAQAQMRRGNTRLPLEMALIKAAMPEASGDAAALATRMDRLERRVGVRDEPQPQPQPQP
ncbi:MAG TPA: DNA polymerase III subunit gamma/tau, partial [Egibacteraceae bacterium]|nr:DNA polymerase III subunit gamma/tau [Egibacteraceae bacterium]